VHGRLPYLESHHPYSINNGGGPLSTNTLATNATHYGGYLEYDTHNIFGTMEEITTNAALRTLRPNQRPFIIGRSTFAGVGKYSGHWVCFILLFGTYHADFITARR
jgi:alpha-glucosidase